MTIFAVTQQAFRGEEDFWSFDFWKNFGHNFFSDTIRNPNFLLDFGTAMVFQIFALGFLRSSRIGSLTWSQYALVLAGSRASISLALQTIQHGSQNGFDMNGLEVSWERVVMEACVGAAIGSINRLTLAPGQALLSKNQRPRPEETFCRQRRRRLNAHGV